MDTRLDRKHETATHAVHDLYRELGLPESEAWTLAHWTLLQGLHHINDQLDQQTESNQ